MLHSCNGEEEFHIRPRDYYGDSEWTGLEGEEVADSR